MFETLPLVSARVPTKGERIQVLGLLRGRLVRSAGKPVAAEIDVLDPVVMRWTGRTTLVPIEDVVPVNPLAAIQMDDMGHAQGCACATCKERHR